MEHKQFREAAAQLQMWAKELTATIEDHSKQCIDALENGTDLADTTPEQLAEIILRRVNKRIEDVMFSFDSALESINMQPRYRWYFRATKLTDTGWTKLIKILDDHSSGEGGSRL